MNGYLHIPLPYREKAWDWVSDDLKVGRKAIFIGWKTEYHAFKLRIGMTHIFKRDLIADLTS